MPRIRDIILRDTRANQPAATVVDVGTLYCVTDEGNIIERSDGTNWQEYSPSVSSGITELTGDVTAGPGSGSQAATLANTAVAAGTYGDATNSPQITVDAKGRITAAVNVPISGGGASGILTAELVVTDAQIRTLNSIPLEIVAAPGANKIIVPVRADFKAIRSGTAFSADPTFRIRWNSITIDLLSTTSFIFNSVVAATIYRLVTPSAFVGGNSDDPTNKALQLSTSADVTLGAGCSVVVTVAYYIADYS